jgi:hypothetical protein
MNKNDKWTYDQVEECCRMLSITLRGFHTREMDEMIFKYNKLKDKYDNLKAKNRKKSKIKNNKARYKTYLMKDTKSGYYKIGKSINPIYRERTLQYEKPSIKLVKVWDNDIEKKLHKEYAYQRLRGEWFKLSLIQVKHICSKN